MVASPELSILATDGSEEVQVTPLERSCELPLVKMAVAVYCWGIPIPSVRSPGVTTMEEIVGELTVSPVEPVIEPRVAEMVVLPELTPVALPLASMVATEVTDEFQETSEVRSRLLPSLLVPIAENCWLVFTGMVAPEGDTVILTRLVPALVTVRIAVAWKLPDTALIVTTPTAAPLASPELLTVAIAVSDELHCAVEVRSLLLPSENEPLAANCCMLPTPVETEPGVICRPCITGGVGVGEGVGVGVGVGPTLRAVVVEPPPPPPQAINKLSPSRSNRNTNRFTVHLQRAHAHTDGISDQKGELLKAANYMPRGIGMRLPSSQY